MNELITHKLVAVGIMDLFCVFRLSQHVLTMSGQAKACSTIYFSLSMLMVYINSDVHNG